MQSDAVFWLSCLIFLFWLIKGTDLLFGVLFLIPDVPAAKDLVSGIGWPKVSIIFASRNEGEKVGKSLIEMLQQDYPNFEVIAVDDRSTDESLSYTRYFDISKNLKRVRVDALPSGWLGKCHALYQGYKVSSGDWLLFTDADVRFEPQALKRTVAAGVGRHVDHLTLFPNLVIGKFIEAVFCISFIMMFNLRYRPWAARFSGSSAHAGIGAFNLIRRDAYEKIGTHQALALEVADDMALGERVKRARLRQIAMYANGTVAVRWFEGFWGAVNSLKKNAYRGVDYNPLLFVAAAIAAVFFNVVPFVWMWSADPVIQLMNLFAVALIFGVHLAGMRHYRMALPAFFVYPLGFLFVMTTIGIAVIGNLLTGSIVWRGTRYTLRELKEFHRKRDRMNSRDHNHGAN